MVAILSNVPLGAAFTEAENMAEGYEFEVDRAVLWVVGNKVGLDVCPVERVCLFRTPFVPLVSIAVELVEATVALCRS
jgi:hypothetical protein